MVGSEDWYGEWCFGLSPGSIGLRSPIRGAARRTFLTEQRKVPAKTEYSHAVARFLLKLMAYKDEFEVARLHYAVAVQIAKIPDDIRGYGHVKMQSLQLAEQKEGKLLEEYFSRVSERSAA